MGMVNVKKYGMNKKWRIWLCSGERAMLRWVAPIRSNRFCWLFSPMVEWMCVCNREGRYAGCSACEWPIFPPICSSFLLGNDLTSCEGTKKKRAELPQRSDQYRILMKTKNVANIVFSSGSSRHSPFRKIVRAPSSSFSAPIVFRSPWIQSMPVWLRLVPVSPTLCCFVGMSLRALGLAPVPTVFVCLPMSAIRCSVFLASRSPRQGLWQVSAGLYLYYVEFRL